MAATPLPLFDELLEEVLLCIPPDDPASLLRAALVCKRWGRLVSGRGFRRRFRDFHRTAPMLGAIVNIDGLSDFTSPAARENEDNPAKRPTAAGSWLGGSYAKAAATWHEASPTFHVSTKTPPILFIGSAQARFAVGREAMIEKMTAQGVAAQTVLLPDTPHSFWLFDPWLAPTVEATVAFLRTRMAASSGRP